MSKYTLTRRVYNTMVGRGYNLVCKICDMPLEIMQEVESKPSKYRKWNCDQCGYSSEDKPDKRSRIGEYWYLQCPECGGIVYCIGRKFYHSTCYEDAHYA